MLTEIHDVRQIPGENSRRWFTDRFFDLIVWHDGAGGVEGFQLCYDKEDTEKALTWYREKGYSHDLIESGDRIGGFKMAPILVGGGEFDAERIIGKFSEENDNLPPDLAELVLEKLQDFASFTESRVAKSD